ncbi:MAG: nucleoside deaminase [Chlorobiaceae bacterium]|nr:nucleoside deaminase [Chlorobiaceae bacterium]NTV17536.1 nucleoside deaminase [Chlorobiaceae bacterium]
MQNCNPELLLPPWLKTFSAGNCGSLLSDDERMRFVIELARQNILHGTGGPFGAAVFERLTGRLISAGVNLVVRSNCSHAHAEMVALAIAQHHLSSYTLSRPDFPEYELVTSSEPCAMCYGAIIWSGISRLVCGAYTSDTEKTGFDEGAKPENWIAELEKRKIEVLTGIRRIDACSVLKVYSDNDGLVYNGQSRQ